MYVSPSMQQVYDKPQSKILTGIHRSAWRNSVRWPLLLVLSGGLLLVLVVVGLGIYTSIDSLEQNSRQARWSENTRQASLLLRERLENRQQILGSLALLSGQEAAQIFPNLIEKDPFWLELARFGADGTLLAGAAKETALLERSAANPQEKWFQQALIGLAYLDLAGASLPGDLVIALPAADGGVIAGRIRAEGLVEAAAPLQPGVFYLINRLDGHVIGYPDLPAGASAGSSAVYSGLLEQPGQPWQGIVKNLSGLEVHAQAAPVKNTDWVVVTEVEQNAATLSAQIMPVLAGGLLLVWAIATLLINAAIEKMVVHPLRLMMEDNPSSARPDEFGQVSTRIHELSAAVNEKEEHLKKARRQLVIDSQFKTDFLARVSHDLRQPMGVILGFAEMLSEEIFGEINKQQRRAVEDILVSTGTLSQEISDLLDTSRLQAQTMHVRSDEFSPELLLRQAASQVRLLAERKELRLETCGDPQLPEMILGDANRVQQIVYNLAVNAIKFTQKGTVSIEFKRYSDEEWGIAVSDTGQGIPEESLSDIFEPFQQVSSQTTRDKGGVGLGLYIVQQLVLLMGGQVQVESIVGSGSTFTVRLPLRTAHAKGS